MVIEIELKYLIPLKKCFTQIMYVLNTLILLYVPFPE